MSNAVIISKAKLMQKLNELMEVLQNVERLSQKIIIKYVKYMKDAMEDESELVKDHQKGMSYGDARNQLFDIFESRVKDSRNIVKELPKFSSLLSKGKMKRELLSKECPFLTPVWYGDMYGEKHLSGLLMLQEDLQTQLTNAKERKFE